MTSSLSLVQAGGYFTMLTKHTRLLSTRGSAQNLSPDWEVQFHTLHFLVGGEKQNIAFDRLECILLRTTEAYNAAYEVLFQFNHFLHCSWVKAQLIMYY